MTEAKWLTEEEWMSTSDTFRMLHHVRRSKTSDRKTRLLNVAMCHLFWGYLTEISKAVISDLECLADGLAIVTPDELCRRANEALPPFDPVFKSSLEREAAKAVCYAVYPYEIFVAEGTCKQIDPNDERPQFIIRDIFGNPFRTVYIAPAWLAWNDGTVVKLAQGIYDDRAFDRLPVLADALEDAGCHDDRLLDHCRQPGQHVRGCWPVDLLLAKE